MGRLLNELTPRFRPLAAELLARATEQGIALMIVCTGRTAEEQAQAVRTGHSKVEHSRHQDGEAIDVAPYSEYYLHGADKLQWDGNDPIWQRLGQIGEDLGLRWGGRFHPLNASGVGWDPGHFEYPSGEKQV
jgi:peptidoglycan L-alanyl-D-glutamate endopeptidase CwlK